MAAAFFAYTKFLKKEPLQTKLVSQKVKEEVLQFTNDYVSQAIYQNLITMDDTVVMLDKEIKRLKRIGTKFPNQRTIITTQTDQLSTTRNRLAKAMGEVTARPRTNICHLVSGAQEGHRSDQSPKTGPQPTINRYHPR